MSLSRRKFLATAATAGGAVLASPAAFSAPYQVSVQRNASPATGAESQTMASGLNPKNVPIVIPATMPMGSGAPLGGIGTGFVEIRADGCFHEWQIFNAGPWAQDVRSTTAPPAPGPQYLRFLLRTKKASDARLRYGASISVPMRTTSTRCHSCRTLSRSTTRPGFP